MKWVAQIPKPVAVAQTLNQTFCMWPLEPRT